MKLKELTEHIKNKYLISRLTMIKDYIFAVIKIIFGVFVQSYFFTVSGLYSICVGLAKNAFFEGKNAEKQLGPDTPEYKANAYKHLAKMAFFILAGSITYVIYMTRLFFLPSDFNYGMIPAIGIAALSFTELVFAIINLKKASGVLYSGLRCINLSSAFTAIVLTQVAILSFAQDTNMSFYNAVSGTIFGGLCIAVALIMFIKYLKYKKTIAKPLMESYDKEAK